MSETKLTNDDQRRRVRRRRFVVKEFQPESISAAEVNQLNQSQGDLSYRTSDSTLMSRQPSHLLSRGPGSRLQRQSSGQVGRESEGGYPQVRLGGRNFAQLAVKDASPGPANCNVVQLRKYKDREVRNLVKEAAKNAAPNAQAIQLAIYNQMRFELDPVPGPFNSVVLAKNAMVQGGRIDEDDAVAIDQEARRLQQAGGDPAEATRLRITEGIAGRRDAVEAAYSHHIFQGDTKNGVPTGFHSIADNSPTHEAYGTRTDVGNGGAYQRSVRLRANGTRKPIQSTFFPDNATHAEVIDAITTVYEVGLSQVGYVAPSVNGLKLTKRGDTVFPAGGSDTLAAE